MTTTAATASTASVLAANAPLIVEAFKQAINTVRNTAGATLRVVFRKKDGTIRTMDVAHDAQMKDSIKGTGDNLSVERRKATNEVRGNLVVRELLADGTFQWRTIPLSRVISISPVF